MYEVQYGIEIPEKQKSTGRPSRYPVATMGVGGSFFVEKACEASVRTTLNRYRKANPKANFVTRQVEEDGVIGLRVWRVEDVDVG